jgi:hypothetical protein
LEGDVAASGVALETLGALTGVTSIAMTGTVDDSNTALTVTLASSTGAFPLTTIATIPLLGPQITSVALSVSTIAAAPDTADTGPGADDLCFSVVFSLPAGAVTLTGAVPMNGGLCTVEATTSGLAVSLSDLDFLTSNAGSSWFPTSELGPFAQTSLQLLGISLDLYLTLSPLTIAVSSVDIGIGFTGQALIANQLYLSPLGVWVTIADPAGAASFTWSVMGTLALCSSAKPGDYQDPDLSLEMAMDLTDYSMSASLENTQSITVNAALADLGAGSIGLGDEVTVTAFDIDFAIDSSGSPTSFDLDIGVSTGLGLFSTLTFEDMNLSIQCSAD